ncbi:sodium:proton antiporter [bacterium]|nr:sodium:proton antiporter [bacterium]MBU1984173.1 sodium:proton antiporter [bacterium]
MEAPPLAWSLPFALLLASIAAFPLISHRWWERNYPWVALPLGTIVAIYYVFFFGGHERMLLTGHEYISFIALIGALFVVSGGIHIRLAGKLTPQQNVGLLAVGAVIANAVGTTGAAMILIRPYIRGNSWRWAPYHIAFFIFIVANCGGALTPVGDPPLFLGYLKGVPFFWVFTHLVHKWAVAIVVLLILFYIVDRREYRQHAYRERAEAEARDRVRFEGWQNIGFAAVIVGAAFIQEPMFVREFIMIAAAVVSYVTTPHRIHRLNEFTFAPIREVAILFAGIFACMVPALDWLSVNAKSLGITDSSQFYWATGVLSAFLDNAPTYLNFLTAGMGLHGLSADNKADVLRFAAEHSHLLRSISIAAVFFGAATYIGNGPNFMCKSICDHAKLKTPTFVGYVWRYALPILLPVLIITFFLVR